MSGDCILKYFLTANNQVLHSVEWECRGLGLEHFEPLYICHIEFASDIIQFMLSFQLWDINMDSGPVATFQVHEYLRPKVRFEVHGHWIAIIGTVHLITNDRILAAV